MGWNEAVTAFILGAGLGTRLRPLTNRRPKPLIPVCNRPLITCAFDHLKQLGVERYVVNTHWLPHVYDEEFPDQQYRGKRIAFRHEPEILETAGGIKNVEDLLGGEPFVVYNGDILTDLPLIGALETHRARGNEITLVLRSKDGPLQVAIDPGTGAVVDIGGRISVANPGTHLFTGIYFVEPEFLRRIPAGEKIGVVRIFLEMIRSGAPLGSVVVDEGMWWDLGSRERYIAVHQHIAGQGNPPAPWVDPSAQVDSSARVTGATAIAANARIGAGARLHDCIVWPGAEIAPLSELTRCVVSGLELVSGSHADSSL